MQNIPNSMTYEKVPGQCLTNFPVDLDELSLRENWVFLSTRSVHLYYSVSAKAIIKNINITGAVLSPFLTPTFNSMDFSTLLMMSLNMILLYICLIAEHSLGVAPYFSSMAIISA